MLYIYIHPSIHPSISLSIAICQDCSSVSSGEKLPTSYPQLCIAQKKTFLTDHIPKLLIQMSSSLAPQVRWFMNRITYKSPPTSRMGAPPCKRFAITYVYHKYKCAYPTYIYIYKYTHTYIYIYIYIYNPIIRIYRDPYIYIYTLYIHCIYIYIYVYIYM